MTVRRPVVTALGGALYRGSSSASSRWSTVRSAGTGGHGRDDLIEVEDEDEDVDHRD
ncbi:MAG: hypothetical protein ABEJ81_02050 [Haloferacaceae archaeon]